MIDVILMALMTILNLGDGDINKTLIWFFLSPNYFKSALESRGLDVV